MKPHIRVAILVHIRKLDGAWRELVPRVQGVEHGGLKRAVAIAEKHPRSVVAVISRQEVGFAVPVEVC